MDVKKTMAHCKSFWGATTECRATSDNLFYMCQNLFENEA